MRRLTLTAGLLIAALYAVPIAQGGGLERPDDVATAEVRSSSTSFHLRGPGGEAVAVAVARRQVNLAVEVGRTSIGYVAEARVTSDRIRADIGRFGHIDVKIEPRGRERFRPIGQGCEGGTRIQRVLVSGTIQFNGDVGYAPLTATRARGVIVRTRIKCRAEGGGTIQIPDEPGQRGSRATVLQADDAGPDTDPSNMFAAIQQDGKRHADFWAFALGREGNVMIYRGASARAASETFVFDARHSSATVTPPAPFTGTGSFLRSGGKRTWTGDLSVTYPGQPPIALTGAPFTADLGRAVLLVAARSARAVVDAARALSPESSG